MPSALLNGCRGVTFDATNTLIYVHPSVGYWYSQIAMQHGVSADEATLERHFRQSWKRHARSDLTTSEQAEHAWWKGLVSDVFTDAEAKGGFAHGFDAFFQDVFDCFASEAAWRCYEDTMPALKALKQRGLKLACVSNFDARLGAIFERIGLAPILDAHITSAACGHRKPSPAIFRHASSALGIAPGELAHVGDSPKEDCAGAEAAGMRAILIKRAGRLPSESLAIRSLHGLVAGHG